MLHRRRRVCGLECWIFAVASLGWSGGGCQRSDVGAPCNHGPRTPQTLAVTFKALACDELLCVYAEDHTPPIDPCDSDDDCDLTGDQHFRCENEKCSLSPTYVLSRSMCSKVCSSDADCEDGYRDTNCESGFACAFLQVTGEFCCEKVCACRDELNLTRSLEIEGICAQGDLICCEQDPLPSGCG